MHLASNQINFTVSIKDGYKIETVAESLRKIGVTVNDMLPAIGIISVTSSTSISAMESVDGVNSVEQEVEYHTQKKR